MGWRSAYTRILERGDPLGLTYASLKQVEAAMLEMPAPDRIALARELLKGTDQDLCRRGMTLAECVSEFHRRAEHQPCPIPRRRAVEAACVALSSAVGCDEPECGACQQAGEDAITAYERAMADAGWRMVRVPDAEPMHGAVSLSSPEWLKVFGKTRDAWANGWNACRAKMLEGGE